MKKTVLIISLLLTVLSAAAQDTCKSFKAIDNSISWERVEQTKLSFEQLKANVIAAGLIAEPIISDNQISGYVTNIFADNRGAGYTTASTPIFITSNSISGTLIIQYKTEKYKTVFKSIILEETMNSAVATQGEKTTLEYWALKKTGFKGTFKRATAEILEYTFAKKFDFSTKALPEW